MVAKSKGVERAILAVFYDLRRMCMPLKIVSGVNPAKMATGKAFDTACENR
jgi:hypothetical protein